MCADLITDYEQTRANLSTSRAESHSPFLITWKDRITTVQVFVVGDGASSFSMPTFHLLPLSQSQLRSQSHLLLDQIGPHLERRSIHKHGVVGRLALARNQFDDFIPQYPTQHSADG
mmetsp:Transcript_24908/g.69255  ORF Transcript_24908/g.69255 Transcript_24908/m.69255 type:complete len:117 (+) Transcript_24908:234-584(+)